MKNIIRNILVTILATAGLSSFGFSQNDITKYKDKIKPNKEYEIKGQDILNVINTLDSFKLMVEEQQLFTDSLIEKVQSVKQERDGIHIALRQLSNASKPSQIIVKTDTVIAQPDTVYLQKLNSMRWIFPIVLVVLVVLVCKGISII